MPLPQTIQSAISAATPWLASVVVVFALMALGAFLVEWRPYRESLAQFRRLGLLWQIVIVLSVGSATRWAGAKGDRSGGLVPTASHVTRGTATDGAGGGLPWGGAGVTSFVVTDTLSFSNLAFSAIAPCSTNVALAATWDSITNREEAIDVYMRTNLVAGAWEYLAEEELDE